LLYPIYADERLHLMSMAVTRDHIADEIRSLSRGIVKTDEPMSMHTTFAIGGPADVYVEPADADDLAAIIAWTHKESVPWFILGGGANLLVSDKGIRGIVIRLGKPFSYTRIEGERVTAGASANLAKMIITAAEAGLTGLECATAVPGTVGGAIVMNAGTHMGRVGDVVESVRIVTAEGERRDLVREELGFSYRQSLLQVDKTKIIVEVSFGLKKGDRAEIVRMVGHLRHRRSVSQPAEKRSAGCVFKNPEGPHSAGWMIDQSGLMGTRVGDAVVSDKHANFILNVGNASAADVRTLAENVRGTVKANYDVDLEYEVRIVGDW
jgi:UDP-N-acetylmuramate dehydrogenase